MPIRIRRATLSSDLVAGLTFALVNAPEAMAHALLASVNPMFGLYTLMLATPVGALFTSTTFMNISTTSAMAVATGDALISYPADTRVTALVTLVLLIGIFQLILGVLRLGWLIRFVSFSVMTGFMTGVAVMIVIGQLGDFTGYYSSYSGRIGQLADVILNLDSIDWATLAIGLMTIGLIFALRRTSWSRFSLVPALLLASGAAILLNRAIGTQIRIVGDIAEFPASLPSPVLPDLDLIFHLIVPAIAIGIIGVVQGAGVSQSFPNPDGKLSDDSRDFLGQGIANLAASIFRGIPAGGSSTATALVVSSGARSRWANIFGGLAVAVIVLFFGNLVELIALPALAGLVIVAGINLINVDDIQMVWQTNDIARAVMLITFGTTVIMPLQYAVFLGVAISILLFILQQANTIRIVEWVIQEEGWPVEQPATEQLDSGRVMVLFAYGNLFYASAETFEKSLPIAEGTSMAAVIMILRGYEDVGSTIMDVVRRYAQDLHANRGKLILAGVSPALWDQLKRTEVLALIGEENVFLAADTLGESGNAALDAANEWLAASTMDSDED